MGLDDKRVDEMLELVGLTKAEAKRRVGNYSLGMRQRLGIANALLGDPRVLILDEPANGLDPAGIHWMRSLLRDFADRGGTAFLSSHLLHEVEVIADELVVIGSGRIVARGTKAELLAGAGTLVRGPEAEALAAALKRAELSFSSADRRWLARRRRVRSRSAALRQSQVSCSASCGLPKAPVSRRCSCSSPPPTHARRWRHDRHGYNR